MFRKICDIRYRSKRGREWAGMGERGRGRGGS